MTATKLSKMSNATARRYYLHSNDMDNKTGQKVCYFSQGKEDDGWGFWVARDGEVTADDVSANGELPSSGVLDACIRSAVKYLNCKPVYAIRD